MSTATDRKQNLAPPAAHFTSADKQLLRRRLFAWYSKSARDLPWRRSRDAYGVWVSEVMLQQTTVAAVRDYFKRFMEAFPDVHALANAPETRVMRAWEGLGYYRRARQLHAAAKKIVAEHGGALPPNVVELQELPGIGRYTAGAIASIAFGQRAPILEANTVRLLSRLIGYREDPLATTGQRVLWRVAEEILPQKNVAHFNQALMELGSLVCTPSVPNCAECPLSAVCTAFSLGLQSEIPRPKARKTYTYLREAAVLVRKNGSVLIRRCGEGERWAGLWDFPRFGLDAEGPLYARDEIVAKVCEQTGVTCAPTGLLKTFKHGVTRYRITLECYEAKHVAGRVHLASSATARWVKFSELSEIPLSATGRQIAKLLPGDTSRSKKS